MSTPYPPGQDDNAPGGGETPLDLLINAISDPADQDGEPGGVASHAYEDAGGFGLVNVGYDGQERPSDMREKEGADRDNGPMTLQQPTASLANMEAVLDGPPLGRDGSQSQKDVSRIAAHITRASQGSNVAGDRDMTSVQIWHPVAAVKSYEVDRRRLMAPPPFVRIRGPLLPHVTSLTLSTVPERAPGPVMASQTHRIAVDNPDTATQSNMDANAVTGLPPIGVGYLASIPIPAPRMRLTSRKIKKLANAEAQQRLREQASRSGFGMTLPHERKSQAQKDRDALYEGLMFPGMWVTSGASRGPDKELCYRLSLDVHVDNATAGSAASQGPWHMPPIAEGQPETAGEAAALGGGHDSSSSEQAAGADVVTIGKADKPWLTLRSVPLTLLTKAGVKTAKARSMAGTIKADEPFALCIRINAQTVRTRYIKTGTIDSRPCLTSRTGQWDPYQFETIQSPPLPEISPRVAGGNGILSVEDQADLARRLRYGTIGRLRDVQTGAVSPPMKLVRTDANEAILGENSGDGDPVSHLQKVAFVRVVQVTATETGGQWKEVLHKESGLRYYLAAPGARAGGGELQEDKAPGWRKRRKVQPKKETSKEAVVDQGAMSVPNVSDMSNDGGSALNDMSSSIQATPGFPPHDTTEGVMHIPEEGQILPDTLAGSLLHDHTGITSIQPEAASNPHGTDSPGPLELYTTQAQLEEQPEALSSSPAPAASTQAVADAKYKTKRGALAQAVVDEQGGDSMIQLAWEVATERKRALRPFGLMKSKYKQEADIEGVADWMTYVIAGVEQTSTSFKSLTEDLHQQSLYRPLEPVQVLAQPAFDTVPTSSGESDALHVIINQEAFISPDRAHEAKLDPPQVYLGDIGPLTCSIMQSTSRTDESICPLVVHPAYAESSEEERHARALRSTSDFPAKVPHLLLYLSPPPVRDIAQALNDLARTTGSDQMPAQPPPEAPPPAQDSLPPQASSSTQDLPPPSDLEAQLTDLDTNLAFEQALNEPNWLADYNNAVQSLDVEMDDTEAIRLALQNVQDVQDAQDAVRAAQLADAAVVAAATAAAEAIDPVLAGLTAEGQGGQADRGAIELDRSIQDLDPPAAAAQTPLAQEPASAASTAEPVALTTSTNGTIGDTAQAGPVLLTPVTDRYTTAQGGRLALPIIVARVGEGVDEAIFQVGYGVTVDSLGELEIVTIA